MQGLWRKDFNNVLLLININKAFLAKEMK